MKNKSSDSRKQTVTLTLGPKTTAILQKVLDQVNAAMPGAHLTLTNTASSMLNRGMRETCEIYDIKIPADLMTTHD